jgi:hypothetical protein
VRLAFALPVDRRHGQPFNDERPGSKNQNSDWLHGILHLLASICVQGEKGEVYAIAIQFHESTDSSNGGIVALTVAGNTLWLFFTLLLRQIRECPLAETLTRVTWHDGQPFITLTAR